MYEHMRARTALEELEQMSVLFPVRLEADLTFDEERVRTIKHNNQIIEETFYHNDHQHPRKRITQTFRRIENGWRTDITKEWLAFSPEAGQVVISVAQRSMLRLPTELINNLCWRQKWTIDQNNAQCTFLARRSEINPLLRLNFYCDRFHADFRRDPFSWEISCVGVELHLSSPQAHLARDRRSIEMLDGVLLFGDSRENRFGVAGEQRFLLRLPIVRYDRSTATDYALAVEEDCPPVGRWHDRHTFWVNNPSAGESSNRPIQDTRDFRYDPREISVDSGAPKICRGCQNFCGKVYGGNLLICAIYPYGNGEECTDFVAK